MSRSASEHTEHTDDETNSQAASETSIPPSSPARTLLPAPLASLVTTFTQTTSVGLRVGTKIGAYAIAGARETTLTSLEFTRAAVEAILTRAGKDVSHRRHHQQLGTAEAETILEQTISSLHYTITSISFFASSAFHLSTAVLTSASSLSVQGLSTLDAVLGSTESSRAVAAIIELIKDEFKKPEPGREHEFVGYMDLFSGTVGFVLLQRWGRRQTERAFRARGGDEVIWDAVIDDKGFRADVVRTERTSSHDPILPRTDEQPRHGRPVSFLSPAGDEAIEAIERGSTVHESPDWSWSVGDQAPPSDEEIRQHITAQLPQGCHAIVSSETLTAKTVRVDLYHSESAELALPPGTILVKEHFRAPERDPSKTEPHLPSQTVVFRTIPRPTSSAEIELPGDAKWTIESADHIHHDTLYDSDDGVVIGGGIPTQPKRQRRLHSNDHIHTSPQDETADAEDETKGPLLDCCWPDTGHGIPIANQKKIRRPVLSPKSSAEMDKPAAAGGDVVADFSKTADATHSGRQKKVSQFRKALKQLSPSSSLARFDENPSLPYHSRLARTKDPKTGAPDQKLLPFIPPFTSWLPPLQTPRNKTLPQLPPGTDGPPSARGRLLSPASRGTAGHSSHQSSWDQRRDTILHQTETYSAQSRPSQPGSPTITRTHSRTMSSMSRARSDRDVSRWNGVEALPREGDNRRRQRSRSFVSSLYSMTTQDSETSLILAPKGLVPTLSIFDDLEVLHALATEGKVPGIFPNDHLVRNVRRYARFSSASYGSQFLRFMGLAADRAHPETAAELQKTDVHHEHSSFYKYTGLPPDTILLSSFEDPHGGLGFSQSPTSALPLAHFISVDGESKAVVLTCRGTLGFEDVLTDMLCDFDDLIWRGNSYKVHKGIHASARRMLDGQGSRVMTTLKAALEEYPDYGLILTGHSLGGAVAALLAILVSEPSTIDESGALFTTTSPQKLIAHPDLTAEPDSYHDPGSRPLPPPITLPAGRPIHVYAYGPPATLSPSLRTATRGLITTIVNSNDIVPSLSLGTLHDFRTVALSLKHDTTGAIAALKSRVWERVRHAAQSAFYVDGGPPPPVQNTAGEGLGEDTWAWSALQTLRAGMTNVKLVPPGEVFIVETSRVFDRQDGFVSPVAGAAATTTTTTTTPDTATDRVFKSLGRPATRVQMKLVRDVETRFGELRFGSRMFSDHSPARYEASLAALESGVLDG